MSVYFADNVNGQDTNDGLTLGNAFKTLSHAFTVLVAADRLNVCANEVLTTKITSAVSCQLVGCNASGVVDGTQPVLTGGAGLLAIDATGGRLHIHNVEFTPDGTTPNPFLSTNGGSIVLNNVKSIGVVSSVFSRQNLNIGINVIALNCVFKNTTACLSEAAANRDAPNYVNCIIEDCVLLYAEGGGNSSSGALTGCTLRNTDMPKSNYLFPRIGSCVISASRIYLGDRAASAGLAYIVNSVLEGNLGNAIEWFAGSETVLVEENNLYFNNATDKANEPASHVVGVNNLSADPLFADSSNGDFAYPIASPLVGAGMNGSDIGGRSHSGGKIYLGDNLVSIS